MNHQTMERDQAKKTNTRRLVYQAKNEERLRPLRGERGILQAADGTEYFKRQDGSVRKVAHVGTPTRVEHNKARIRRQRKAAGR